LSEDTALINFHDRPVTFSGDMSQSVDKFSARLQNP